MGLERIMLKAYQMKLEAHNSQTPEDIKKNLNGINALIDDPECDPRTRFMALRFLTEHDWNVYEHENPAVQKVEHSGSVDNIIRFPLKSEIGTSIDGVDTDNKTGSGNQS